MEKSLFTFHRG